MPHRIFVDRVLGQKNGFLTLQEGNTEIFKRLPVASGQFPYLDGGSEDWIRGEGATPFGNFWMSTKSEPLQMEPFGTPFYIISTEKGSRVIIGPNGKTRDDIGLHLENDKPGTSGCTALLNDTPLRECLVWSLFEYLNRLHKYEPYIRYTVL